MASQTWKNLTVLNLEHSGLNSECIGSLVNMDLSQLKELYLSYNPIRHTGCFLLIKAQIPQLRRL